MKKPFVSASLAFLMLFLPAYFVASGCATTGSSQTATVSTLAIVGHSAEAAVATSAQLYKDGRITANQAWFVRDTYDLKFMPVYRVAVKAAKMDLSQPSSAELIQIGDELTRLIVFYSKNQGT